jgi:CHAD domain-containing protein
MNGRSELLIRQRLSALTRALPQAQQGSAEAIHRARVATRRLREALPLVSTGPAGRKLQRRVRRITRALGPVRELDVALQMLEEFERTDDVPRAGIACLRSSIGQERQRMHGDLVHTLERIDIDKLSRKAVAAAQACDVRPSPAAGTDPKRRADAATRAARRAERLRITIETAGGIYLPDRLHEVRIAVKKLRYAVEIAEVHRVRRAARTPRAAAGRTKGSAAALRTLKRAQVLLGRMHDLEVLIARTRGVQGSTAAPALHVSADLDRLVRRLEMECRQLHAQYMTGRSALLAVCAAVAARPRRRAPAA